MFLSGLTLLFIYLSLFVCADFIGYLFLRALGENKNYSILSPIFGFSIIIILASATFILLDNSIVGGFMGVVLGLILHSFFRKRINWIAYFQQLQQRFLLLLITGFMITIPYFFTQGRNIKIPGYYISNDSVIHAVLSRSCDQNYDLSDKFATKNILNKCSLPYPIGGHSIINLISNFTTVDNSYLVFLTSGYMGTLTVFIVYLLLDQLKIRRPISKSTKVFISILSASSYYSLAIIYHGFFPQTVYVPFMLSAGFWYLSRGKAKNGKSWLSESVLFSAVILIYGFVAAIPIIAVIGIRLISEILSGLSRYNRKMMAYIKRSLFTLSFTFILSFVVIYPTIVVFYSNYMKPTHQREVQEDFRETKGNLVTSLSPFIGSGIWFEADYRLLKMDKFAGIHYYVSIGIVLISLSFMLIRTSGSARSLFVSLLFAHAINYVFVGSPYTLTKTYSLIAPLLVMGFLVAMSTIFQNKLIRTTIMFIYFMGFMASNLLLLKNISTYSADGISAMKQLKETIGRQAALIHSSNDWLIYYADSPSTDIVGLHYLPDKNINYERVYKYVVFEGDNEKIQKFECIDKDKYYNFTVCKLD